MKTLLDAVRECLHLRRWASKVMALWMILFLLSLAMLILFVFEPSHSRGTAICWTVGLSIGGVHQVLLAVYAWNDDAPKLATKSRR